MKTTKVWRFYTKGGIDNDEKYHLYAITNQKDFAKQFQEERDMNKFIVKKSEEDFDDWKELAREAGDAVLDIRDLQTKHKTDTNTYSTIGVPILCTMYEYQTVDADFAELPIMTEEFWFRMPDLGIFNNKLIDSLKILEYHRYYRLFVIALQRNDDEDDDYAAPNTEIDEVGILISTFSNLFK